MSGLANTAPISAVEGERGWHGGGPLRVGLTGIQHVTLPVVVLSRKGKMVD